MALLLRLVYILMPDLPASRQGQRITHLRDASSGGEQWS